MKSLVKKAVLGALVLGLSASAASANIIYTLNATLNNNATITGTFTTNNAINAILSASLLSSSGLTYTYTLSPSGGNSSIAQSLPTQYFQFDNGANELRVYFSGGLTATGGVIDFGHSYDYQPGISQVTPGDVFKSGSVTLASTAVPEPSSIALMGTALVMLAGVAGALRLRKPALKAVTA